MPKVSTNSVSLRYGVQSALGSDPTVWKQLEPNTVGSFGNAITTVARRPISPRRGRRKGTTTDRDSTPEMDGDLTLDSFIDFIEGFMYAQAVNSDFDLRSSGAAPAAVASTDDFTVDALGPTLAAKILDSSTTTTASGTLLYGKGYNNSANNGFHVVNASVTGASTALSTSSALEDETPLSTTSPSPSLQIAGMRFAAGELAFTLSGSTATLVASTTGLTDWADLGLQAGMFIHIGSDDGTGAVQNALDDGAGTNNVYGYARISSISTTTLNLDKLDTNLDATDAANANTTDVMFGRFIRNVAVSDSDYIERLYQFEATWSTLGSGSVPEYEYAIDNQANEMVVNLPLTDKATVSWGFQGTRVEDIVVAGSRKSGAADAPEPLRTTAMNTSSDIASITTDVVSAVSDICFKSLTLTIANNASPEKCLGTVGASFINTGLFEVNLEGEMLFTSKEIVNAVSNNTTVTFLTIMKNEDGAIAMDMPTLTLSDGGRNLPVDESVTVTLTGASFTDPSLGYDFGVTVLASVPTVRD
ncbi:MAG: phage tail tube protein [Rhodothermales bacterium]|nr:phage tail tube protein [Rhodothermales bacterium]